jgi:hypothetical protein
VHRRARVLAWTLTSQRAKPDVALEQRTKVTVEALLADLDHARELSAAAERRGRTYLAGRGVLDQTKRDLSSLLREALADP